DIQTHSVAAGSYKNICDNFTAMSDDQQRLLQELVDNAYQQFTNDVSKYRHLLINQKNTWADGKIFTGNQALSLQLIDTIGNQSTALDYIKAHILHEDREFEFIKAASPSRFQQLFSGSDDQ